MSITHILKKYILPPHTYRRLFAKLLLSFISLNKNISKRLCLNNFKICMSVIAKRFHCNVCGKVSSIFFDFPDNELRVKHGIGILRETCQCRFCGSTLRDRSLSYGLLKVLSDKLNMHFSSIHDVAQYGLHGISILDTDHFSPISKQLGHLRGYMQCSYLPDRPLGLIADNYYNIDLQKIDFDSNTFDIVLTSDVMEHVRLYCDAHSEIYRILKPRGTYVFNIPYNDNIDEHIILVDTTSHDYDVILGESHYHGDPLSDGKGILSYRIFGKYIFSEMRELGFNLVYYDVNDDHEFIVHGDLFIATKDNT